MAKTSSGAGTKKINVDVESMGGTPIVEEKKVGKKVAGMSQAEITIIEEKLSAIHGILPIEIAGSLSNRFDKNLEKQNTVRSEFAYVETKFKDAKERVLKIADINSRLAELKKERQTLIGKWHKKVDTYINEVYGDPVIENGVTVSHGDRIEVMRNKHLKKFW